MDMGNIMKEVQRVKSQKKYLQSSHINLSMRKYNDQFQSMNTEQREKSMLH